MRRARTLVVLATAIVVAVVCGYVVVAGCALGSVGTLGGSSSCSLTGGDGVVLLIGASAAVVAVASVVSLVRGR